MFLDRQVRRLRIFQRNHLLDFVKISKYFKGRERLADCGSSSVITFWTLSKFQNISKSAVGRDAPMKVSRLAGRERLADCGSSSVITFWTLSKFQNISRSVVGRDSPIGVLSTARSRTDRRSRIFQRNHLLDFENFYFKVSDQWEETRRSKVSRPAGREQLADCGSSSVITFWTLSKFQNISESVVGRHSPIVVLSLCSVQTDNRGCSSVMTFWTFKIF